MQRTMFARNVQIMLVTGSAVFALDDLSAAEAGAMPMPMNHAEEQADAGVVRGKGVVQSKNASADTVTLAHEAIAAIDWPAMTMAFKVTNNAEEQVEAGDTVEFEMTGAGGEYTITRIEKIE